MSLKLKDEDSTKRMKDMQEELKDPSLGEFSDLEQDPYVIESKRTTPIDKPVYQPDGKLSSATDRNPYILSEEKQVFKCGPRVRTVTACQGNQICPSGNIDTYDIAKKLDARYYARELPHKFKFGVTGCQNNCLKAEENDVGIKGACVVSYDEPSCIMCGVCVKACRENAITIEDGKLTLDTSKCNYCGRCAKACPTDAWKGESGYLVSFGGLFGNQICKGESFLPVITSEEQLFRVTDAAIQFFDDYANPSERFRFTLDRVGIDKFKEVIKEAYNG